MTGDRPLPARLAPSHPERLVVAYGDELLKIARDRKEIVVMDGDLLSDCGIEAFKDELPERWRRPSCLRLSALLSSVPPF